MSYLEPVGAVLLIVGCIFLWKVVRTRSRLAKAGAAMCILAAGVVSAGLTVTFLFAHVMCGEYVLPGVEAPDHSSVAQVTEFDCGATTPFYSYVRIRSTRSTSARFGWNRWHTVFEIEHDPRLISLTWTGTHELTIHYPIAFRHPERLKCESQWGDIKINCVSYKPDEKVRVPQLPEPNRWYW